jgi:preprotein translocase subunit YajC
VAKRRDLEEILSFASRHFQDLPPAPGQTDAASASQAQPAPDGEGVPTTGGGLGMLFPLLLLIPLLLMMFFSTRSQQKKQQAALADLKKGDRVLTQSGLVGKLIEMGDRYAKVELAPGVKVDFVKTGLIGKDTAENAAAVDKKK